MSKSIIYPSNIQGQKNFQPFLLFSEDFESPVVSGYSQATIPDNGNWKQTTGIYRGTYNGIINQDSGAFVGGGEHGDQAYAFRYTAGNGIMTLEGKVAGVQAGTYKFDFDVQEDTGDQGSNRSYYHFHLRSVPLGSGRDGTINTIGTELINQKAQVPLGPSWTRVSIEFTIDPVTHSALIGQDLMIGFEDVWSSGNTINSGVIDNVKVIRRGIE